MAVERIDSVKRRRTYGVEKEWFPVLEELGPSRLRRALIAEGTSPAVAGNVVWFVEDQIALDRRSDAKTRTNYRRELRKHDTERVRKLARSIPGYLKSAA